MCDGGGGGGGSTPFDRQPIREKLKYKAWLHIFLGFVCMVTIIGIPIAFLFFILARRTFRKRASYPVIEITCKVCGKKYVVEPYIHGITCDYCRQSVYVKG